MPPSSLSPEVEKFKNKMILASNAEDWPVRITSASSDKKLRDILDSVLCKALLLQKDIITSSDCLAITKLVQGLNNDEVEEWKQMIQKGDWAGLITHPKFLKSAQDPIIDRRLIRRVREYNTKLGEAYAQRFMGNFATEFIKYIEEADRVNQSGQERGLYAKTISVVQSSGTGKSRMLAEVGKQMFTLPICLRKADDEGYPPGDRPVVEFFSTLARNNDLSLTAHSKIACFIAAAHEMMYETLKARHDQGLKGQQLLQYWHALMEPIGARDGREDFFTKVVERANTFKVKPFPREDATLDDSPIKGENREAPSNFNPCEMASHYYEQHAKKVTEDLMKFLSKVFPEQRITRSVMYFDEAQELGSLFWVILRLVQHQPPFTRMWYIFMGTKSRVSDYAPPPSEMLSARLRQQSSRLLPPYIDLGFDQRAIAKSKAPVTVRMGDLETIKFISQYGRPMWSAPSGVHEDETITMASYKLLNGKLLDVNNKNQVFAILSQRLCLDLVLSATEAIKLADRSVGHHMRLLTGVATNSDGFYTHSPSEPILVMGSMDILYNTERKLLGKVLNTLSIGLCGAGLVEKGIWGELCARTLLLIARDFAAEHNFQQSVQRFLKPVRLMHFLHKLFGRNIFDHSDKSKFDSAFGNAYMNFTHWICTRDPIPPEPNQQMLANLWARGGALQCDFSQEKIDLLIPVYHGSIHPDSIFDPSLLSAIEVQIKLKTDEDLDAELVPSPIGVVRDLDHPLPYLAILMELGCEERFKENGKIKYLASEPLADGAFRSLYEAWKVAAKDLKLNTSKDAVEALKKKATNARVAVDSYNRYSISVRGASPEEYDILRSANIEEEFATLLRIVMPSSEAERTRRHMRPVEYLSAKSPHSDWTWKYGLSNEEWQLDLQD